MGTAIEEVFVVTSTGSGHLFPSMELCKHISSRNYKTTLISAPSSAGSPMTGSNPTHQQIQSDLATRLSRISSGSDPTRSLCAIVDFQMGWTNPTFSKFKIPVISLFTFGACAAAMEWGAWKSKADKISTGEEITIPGLPEEMSITYSDVQRRQGGEPGPRRGPPEPGDEPPWVRLIEGSIGLMFNTCDDLERPFIDYLADQLGIPVWGVGPLLPEQCWQPSGPIISDRQIRQANNLSNYSEDEVIQWLDSKPRASVLYVAFGSEVGPTREEYPELASALEDSTHPFIWVIPARPRGRPESSGSGGGGGDYFPHEMESRVGNRGMIIKGWAPQLMILSHQSTAGFLSHCGWNSTVEAVVRGVPMLTWPIRGDQMYNAKLVEGYLKIGYSVLGGRGMVKKEYILEGIEKLMNGADLHERAAAIRVKFQDGFPPSSESCLDNFLDFVKQKAASIGAGELS
ncbi:hypothetical protein LguiB_028418 [Lonicera macranthoides]